MPSALTEREQQVLCLMLAGRSLRETADEMFISYNTVKKMRQSIFDKIGVRSQKELVLRRCWNALEHHKQG